MHNRRRQLLAGYAVMAKGEYGPTSNWVLRQNGTLTVSGYGRSWNDSSKHFWRDYIPFIKRAYLEEGITDLIDSAFYNGSDFEEILLPSTLTKIGTNAFANSALTDFGFIPVGVMEIGTNAFSGTNITEIDFPEGLVTIGSAVCDGCTLLTSVTIPSTVEFIGGYAFRNTAITEIDLPVSVKTLGQYWISGTDTKNVYYEGTIDDWCTIDRGTMGNFNLYCNNVLQSSVTTNASVIKPYTFEHMKQLNSVSFTQDISLPLTSGYVFASSTISNVTFPQSVNVIPRYTFFSCPQRPNLVFLGNITEIGTSAFNNSAIGTIDFTHNTQVPAAVEGSSFRGCNVNQILIPQSLYSQWYADPAWDPVKDKLAAV